MQKILVTGGLGFIGSNFIREFIDKYKILNFDKQTYCGNPDNLREFHPNKHLNYSYIKGDICDYELALNTIKSFKPDAILHLAAESHVDRSITGPIIFTQTNVMGTACLLEAARQAKVSRFLNMATDEIYGALDLGTRKKFTENSPIIPSSPYSAAKAGAKLLADAYYKTFKFPVLCAASGNAFGPYQYPEKLIPLMIILAMDGKKLPVYGDGLNVRDWIYVRDLAQALEIVLWQGQVGQTYNISARNEINNLNIVKTILKELGKPQDLISFVEDRKGHDRRYAVSNTKIKQLGWSPKTKFRDGIKKTIQWYIENEDWWKKLYKSKS